MFSFRLEKIQHISAVFSLSLFFCPSPAVFRKSERMNPTKTSSPTKSTVKHWTCQFLACATKCACFGAGRAPMLRPPKKCGWIRSGVSPVCEMNEFLWTFPYVRSDTSQSRTWHKHNSKTGFINGMQKASTHEDWENRFEIIVLSSYIEQWIRILDFCSKCIENSKPLPFVLEFNP